MGTRYEMPVGESALNQELVFEGAGPGVAPTPNSIALFVGDNAKPTNTHLVIIAIEQAMTAMKEALTNEGQESVLDLTDIRDPLAPVRRVSQILADATEAHIWIVYAGTVLESSKSEFFVGAIEKLISTYRNHQGVGSVTTTYVVPSGAIVQAAGTYISAATFDLTGNGIWQQGTGIDVGGTTDAGVFGLNILTPRDMGLNEVSLALAEFLKGWSQATFKFVQHPSDPNISSIGMLAFAGGENVMFDSLVITPVP